MEAKMMEKQIISVCMLLTGCIGYSNPVEIVNAYTDNFYSEQLKDGLINNGPRFNHPSIHYEKISGYTPNESYYKPKFYYYPDNSCFLIDYDVRELFQQKIAAGYAPESMDAIFLLEPKEIRLVDRSEYERIKPTLKPYPYDPALCKPKPEK
jgi:hypothetical protein